MKKILVVHYSQTGQLERLVGQFLMPLHDADGIEIDVLPLQPQQPFSFPWKFWRFFNTFPETVHLRPAPIENPQIPSERYDLVVLAYTVWFLSPSQPVAAFLQHPAARAVLEGTPVVTLTGCRNMWLTAHQTVRKILSDMGARLVGNIVKIDHCGSAASFVTTPAWMLTGDKQFFKKLPAAGISEAEIADCARFGEKLRSVLESGAALDETLFQNMGAAKVNEKLMFGEQAAYRSFRIWGKGLMAAGSVSPWLRRVLLAAYIVFLIGIILTVVPAGALLRRLLAPFCETRIRRKKQELAAPSGE
ncbi:MAG: dialkylresorcinol condensing enzyme [Neisseria sp.]|nr:dialkylresorcinol condensing enzyme [Neisseria sp.]